MVSQPYALGHSLRCVFPHLGSTDIPFLSYPLKDKYVKLMGKDKGYNSSHLYCQVKWWSKKSCKIFSNDFGKDFWNDMMEGEKIKSHQKEFLKLKCFSPLKILTSPFIWRDSWSFFLCSVSWGLGGFDDIWGENHFFKNFFSNGFNILAMDAYSGMKLCMPTWLNHDYGDGELWIYWWWTHILEWSYAPQYFWVRLAINVGGESF
jgi:hypothetical protein